jgi:hypothetical protein
MSVLFAWITALVLSVAAGGSGWPGVVMVRARQDPPAGTSAISGHVIDGMTGKPIGGAIVSLLELYSGPTEFPLENSGYMIVTSSNELSHVLTDAEGRFAFEHLSSGGLTLCARKPGWAGGSYGQPSWGSRESEWIDLANGQRVDRIALSMWREPTISGHLLDEAGEPIVGATVQAFPPASVAGHQGFGMARVETTDDRGMFEFVLGPGEYVVGAVLGRAFRAPGVRGRPRMYRSIFYPAASSASMAAIITVTAGEHRTGVDLQAVATPVFRVTGQLSGATALNGLTVRLVRDDADVFVYHSVQPAAASASAEGLFTIADVPPGQYRLRAFRGPGMPEVTHGVMPLTVLPPAPTLSADVPVIVADRDLDGIAVTLREGVRISGRVEFEGSRPRPTVDELNQNLLRIGAADGEEIDLRGTFLSGGRFTTIQIPPGTYLVSYFPRDGWTLKSVMAAGRDIADEPLDVGASAIDNVVMTLTDRPSKLLGRVSDPTGRNRRSSVIVFPSERSMWKDYGQFPRRIRIVEPGTSGTYAVELPSGDYLAVAVGGGLSALRTPEEFASLAAKATRLWVADGETKTLNLQLQRGQ